MGTVRKDAKKTGQSTHAELRRSVDELEGDLLKIPARGVHHEGLAEGDDTLLGTGDGALEHQEVVLDDAVVGEAAHRGDGLLCDIRLCRRVGVTLASTNAVDLLVDLSTVVVSV